VRRHGAAFDIPEWEGGVMPPHSKAPSAHQRSEVSGENVNNAETDIFQNSKNSAFSAFSAVRFCFSV
jgi:hypothetical protein